MQLARLGESIREALEDEAAAVTCVIPCSDDGIGAVVVETMKERLYKVIFLSQGDTYEVYARQVSQGGLFGFIELEELVFGEKTQIVVDPSEERLQKEFEGVERVFLPMHSILRIDEVQKRGTSRITPSDDDGGKVASFPVPIYTPGGEQKP